jgi:hypothetical protein
LGDKKKGVVGGLVMVKILEFGKIIGFLSKMDLNSWHNSHWFPMSLESRIFSWKDPMFGTKLSLTTALMPLKQIILNKSILSTNTRRTNLCG